MKSTNLVSLKWLVLLQLLLAYEWLQSGIDKFIKPKFMDHIDRTLGMITEGTTYQWYSDFLGMANPQFWGDITRYAELAVGVGILFGSLYVWRWRRWSKWPVSLLLIGLYGGALLNLNFYLAAGWNSLSTAELNLVMGVMQLILGTYYLRCLLRRQ